MDVTDDKTVVKVDKKDISKYISACLFSLSKESEVNIVSRGSNIKKAIDVLAILMREYLEDAKYEIKVGTEPYETRNVSTLEIHLTGKQKEKRIK